MPNPIKYNVSAQTLALKKGNFWIGTNDVSKATTANTDYWSGITPPTGGYTIYLNKATQGPSIYVASNDVELISLTNRIAGAAYTTASQCLDYFSTQTDKMVLNRDYPAIVTNGLTLMLDSGFTPSYQTTGTTWYDLSATSSNITATLVNGPTFSSSTGGYIQFDGVNDYCSTNLSKTFSSMTIQVWFYADGNNQVLFTGLVSQRVSTYTTGLLLNINGNRTPGYNWNNDPLAYNWQAGGLTFTYYGWNFLSLVVTPTYARICLNGTFSSDNSITHSPTIISALEIGRDTVGGRIFNGGIASVYIYDRALSNTEVLQNYNATSGRFSSVTKIPMFTTWNNCGSSPQQVYLASGGFTIGNTVYTNPACTTPYANQFVFATSIWPDTIYNTDGIQTNASGVIISITASYGGCTPTFC